MEIRSQAGQLNVGISECFIMNEGRGSPMMIQINDPVNGYRNKFL